MDFTLFLTQAMESKLLVGGKNIVDHTNEQQKILEQKRQEIAEQVTLRSYVGRKARTDTCGMRAASEGAERSWQPPASRRPTGSIQTHTV